MKKTILLFISFFMVVSMKAQTITVDGDMSDWAEVPVLSEPGVFPYAKVHVTSSSMFYNIGYALEGDDKFPAPSEWYFVDMYIDADNDATGYSHWAYVSSKMDYMVDGPDFKYYIGTGSDFSFSAGGVRPVRSRSASEKEAEGAIDRSYFTEIPLSNEFTIALRYYRVGVTGEHYIQPNSWNFAYRKGATIKNRITATEDAGKIELTSANAFYMPFMRDENINEYIDFQSGAYPTQDYEQWASWAINLTTPAIYDMKMTYTCNAGAKMDFYLVDMATNTIVFTKENVDYVTNDADEFSEKHLTGSQLDLSAVPAGKYMLKIKKQVKWDANNLKIQKLVLENTNQTSLPNIINESGINLSSNAGELNITTQQRCDVRVYSLTGVQVFESRNITAVNVPLAQGVYIVKIDIAGKTSTQKIFVRNK